MSVGFTILRQIDEIEDTGESDPVYSYAWGVVWSH